MVDQLRIPEHVQRLWLHSLHGAWERINRERLGRRLRAPQMAIDLASRRLGRWEPKTRTIGISAEHIAAATWAEVEDTLRHEMAHQVVSELFSAPGAAPHGALFARACQMLGVHSAARAEPSPEHQRVLARVRKLMALSQSPNEHEARSAMAAANKLLLRHNLDVAETVAEERRHTYRRIGEPTGRVTLERKLISTILQQHFFVSCVWIRTWETLTKKTVSYLEVLGTPENLELAEYVHDYLLRTLDGLWREYKRGLRRSSLAIRNEYRAGVLMGFRDHLDAQRTTFEEEGLVWLGDPGLDELMGERHPRLRSMRRSSYRIGAAHQAGRAHGRKVRIRPGLGDDPTSRGRLLNS